MRHLIRLGARRSLGRIRGFKPAQIADCGGCTALLDPLFELFLGDGFGLPRSLLLGCAMDHGVDSDAEVYLLLNTLRWNMLCGGHKAVLSLLH